MELIPVVHIRSLHPYSFRTEKWLIFLGFGVVKQRNCYLVLDRDSGIIDAWPIDDPSLKGKIEFRTMDIWCQTLEQRKLF